MFILKDLFKLNPGSKSSNSASNDNSKKENEKAVENKLLTRKRNWFSRDSKGENSNLDNVKNNVESVENYKEKSIKLNEDSKNQNFDIENTHHRCHSKYKFEESKTSFSASTKHNRRYKTNDRYEREIRKKQSLRRKYQEESSTESTSDEETYTSKDIDLDEELENYYDSSSEFFSQRSSTEIHETSTFRHGKNIKNPHQMKFTVIKKSSRNNKCPNKYEHSDGNFSKRSSSFSREENIDKYRFSGRHHQDYSNQKLVIVQKTNFPKKSSRNKQKEILLIPSKTKGIKRSRIINESSSSSIRRNLSSPSSNSSKSEEYSRKRSRCYRKSSHRSFKKRKSRNNEFATNRNKHFEIPQKLEKNTNENSALVKNDDNKKEKAIAKNKRHDDKVLEKGIGEPNFEDFEKGREIRNKQTHRINNNPCKDENSTKRNNKHNFYSYFNSLERGDRVIKETNEKIECSCSMTKLLLEKKQKHHSQNVDKSPIKNNNSSVAAYMVLKSNSRKSPRKFIPTSSFKSKRIERKKEKNLKLFKELEEMIRDRKSKRLKPKYNNIDNVSAISLVETKKEKNIYKEIHKNILKNYKTSNRDIILTELKNLSKTNKNCLDVHIGNKGKSSSFITKPALEISIIPGIEISPSSIKATHHKPTKKMAKNHNNKVLLDVGENSKRSATNKVKKVTNSDNSLEKSRSLSDTTDVMSSEKPESKITDFTVKTKDSSLLVLRLEESENNFNKNKFSQGENSVISVNRNSSLKVKSERVKKGFLLPPPEGLIPVELMDTRKTAAATTISGDTLLLAITDSEIWDNNVNIEKRISRNNEGENPLECLAKIKSLEDSLQKSIAKDLKKNCSKIMERDSFTTVDGSFITTAETQKWMEEWENQVKLKVLEQLRNKVSQFSMDKNKSNVQKNQITDSLLPKMFNDIETMSKKSIQTETKIRKRSNLCISPLETVFESEEQPITEVKQKKSLTEEDLCYNESNLKEFEDELSSIKNLKDLSKMEEQMKKAFGLYSFNLNIKIDSDTPLTKRVPSQKLIENKKDMEKSSEVLLGTFDYEKFNENENFRNKSKKTNSTITSSEAATSQISTKPKIDKKTSRLPIFIGKGQKYEFKNKQTCIFKLPKVESEDNNRIIPTGKRIKISLDKEVMCEFGKGSVKVENTINNKEEREKKDQTTICDDNFIFKENKSIFCDLTERRRGFHNLLKLDKTVNTELCTRTLCDQQVECNLKIKEKTFNAETTTSKEDSFMKSSKECQTEFHLRKNTTSKATNTNTKSNVVERETFCDRRDFSESVDASSMTNQTISHSILNEETSELISVLDDRIRKLSKTKKVKNKGDTRSTSNLKEVLNYVKKSLLSCKGSQVEFLQDRKIKRERMQKYQVLARSKTSFCKFRPKCTKKESFANKKNIVNDEVNNLSSFQKRKVYWESIKKQKGKVPTKKSKCYLMKKSKDKFKTQEENTSSESTIKIDESETNLIESINDYDEEVFKCPKRMRVRHSSSLILIKRKESNIKLEERPSTSTDDRRRIQDERFPKFFSYDGHENYCQTRSKRINQPVEHCSFCKNRLQLNKRDSISMLESIVLDSSFHENSKSNKGINFDLSQLCDGNLDQPSDNKFVEKVRKRAKELLKNFINHVSKEEEEEETLSKSCSITFELDERNNSDKVLKSTAQVESLNGEKKEYSYVQPNNNSKYDKNVESSSTNTEESTNISYSSSSKNETTSSVTKSTSKNFSSGNTISFSEQNSEKCIENNEEHYKTLMLARAEIRPQIFLHKDIQSSQTYEGKTKWAKSSDLVDEKNSVFKLQHFPSFTFLDDEDEDTTSQKPLKLAKSFESEKKANLLLTLQDDALLKNKIDSLLSSNGERLDVKQFNTIATNTDHETIVSLDGKVFNPSINSSYLFQNKETSAQNSEISHQNFVISKTESSFSFSPTESSNLSQKGENSIQNFTETISSCSANYFLPKSSENSESCSVASSSITVLDMTQNSNIKTSNNHGTTKDFLLKNTRRNSSESEDISKQFEDYSKPSKIYESKGDLLFSSIKVYHENLNIANNLNSSSINGKSDEDNKFSSSNSAIVEEIFKKPSNFKNFDDISLINTNNFEQQSSLQANNKFSKINPEEIDSGIESTKNKLRPENLLSKSTTKDLKQMSNFTFSFSTNQCYATECLYNNKLMNGGLNSGLFQDFKRKSWNKKIALNKSSRTIQKQTRYNLNQRECLRAFCKSMGSTKEEESTRKNYLPNKDSKNNLWAKVDFERDSGRETLFSSENSYGKATENYSESIDLSNNLEKEDSSSLDESNTLIQDEIITTVEDLEKLENFYFKTDDDQTIDEIFISKVDRQLPEKDFVEILSVRSKPNCTLSQTDFSKDFLQINDKTSEELASIKIKVSFKMSDDDDNNSEQLFNIEPKSKISIIERNNERDGDIEIENKSKKSKKEIEDNNRVKICCKKKKRKFGCFKSNKGEEISSLRKLKAFFTTKTIKDDYQK